MSYRPGNVNSVIGLIRGLTPNTHNCIAKVEKGLTIRIGTDSDNDVVVSSEFASPLQAVISTRISSTPWYNAFITDYSTNGTYLNGELIGFNKTVMLLPNCIMSFCSPYINLSYMFVPPIDFQENTILRVKCTDNIEERTVIETTEKNDVPGCFTVNVTDNIVGDGSQAEAALAFLENRRRIQLVCRKSKTIKPTQQPSKTELDILRGSNHPNVLRMVGEINRGTEDSPVMWTLSPLYGGGDLKACVSDCPNCIVPEDFAFFVFYQLMAGLKYIHAMGIAHCDIKPENIVLANIESRPRVVIIDFGLALLVTKHKKFPVEYGTPMFFAPECVKNTAFDQKIDCWAAGAVLYYMLSGKYPFRPKDSHSTINEAILTTTPDFSQMQASEQAKFTVKMMLRKKAIDRPSAQESLTLDWVVKNTTALFFEEYGRVFEEYRQERLFWSGEGCESIPVERVAPRGEGVADDFECEVQESSRPARRSRILQAIDGQLLEQ